MSDIKPGQQQSVPRNLYDMMPEFDGNNLAASLDHMAEHAANDLDVNCIMISVSHGELLQTLGSFPTIGEDHKARAHNLGDTLCALTMKRKAPLSVEDARLDPSLRDLAYVKNGRIVGYLGVPIDVPGYGFVGSLCAISKVPRAWVPLELKYLEQFSRTVSMCLLAGMSRIEQSNLSDDLSALDQIVATLAAELSVPTSIYSESGEMAFANAALTAVAPLEIATPYQINKQARAGNADRDNDTVQPNSEWIKFENHSGKQAVCRVVCSKSDSGMTVCNWFPTPSEVG